MSLWGYGRIHFLFPSLCSPDRSLADGATCTATPTAPLLLSICSLRVRNGSVNNCQHSQNIRRKQGGKNGRRINLWERLEDYYHWKLPRLMRTCIYNVCADSFNYSRFQAAPGPGQLEPSVNICSAPGCDICWRFVSETVEMSHRTEDIPSSRADSVSTEQVALVVPHTEWWSHRSELVLSTSEWSSPHKRCPETIPVELRQALQETRNRPHWPKVSSCFLNVYSN